MIRSVYPIPPARPSRQRFDLATRRTHRAIGQRRRDLRISLKPSRLAPVEAIGGTYMTLRWREDVRRGRLAYNEFEQKYDRLVGLLCLAAQEGVTGDREDRYRLERVWFVKNYKGVKGELGRYLQTDASDTVPGLWGRRPCDAFEALFLPATLTAMLTADEGNLIGRLMRTQEAMIAWEASLRRAEKVLAEAA